MKSDEFNKFMQQLKSEYDIEGKITSTEIENGVAFIKLQGDNGFRDFAHYHVYSILNNGIITKYFFKGPHGFTVIVSCHH